VPNKALESNLHPRGELTRPGNPEIFVTATRALGRRCLSLDVGF